MNMLVPMAVAVGIPLVFLYLVRRLDLYASGGFHVVVTCFLGGLAALPIAYVFNSEARDLLMAGLPLGPLAVHPSLAALSLGLSGAAAVHLVKTAIAPVVEEVAKSLSLVWFSRGTEFSYFVDGAIYGFAAGTAFAVGENLLYLRQADEALGLAVNRAFSTSLMHGSASALVGVSLGRFRFGRGSARAISLVLGWAAAILLHVAFNRLVNSGPLTSVTLALAFGVGLGGVALTMAFIRWGLREEAAWLRETLGLDVGVSRQESEVVQRLADLDTLLAPVEAHFGVEKRKAAERFLRLQAQLGLKTKAASMAQEPALAERLRAQAAELRAQMDGIRRDLGVYCMSYVRSILPPETETLWQGIAVALNEAREPSMDLWSTLDARSTERASTDHR